METGGQNNPKGGGDSLKEKAGYLWWRWRDLETNNKHGNIGPLEHWESRFLLKFGHCEKVNSYLR